MSVSLIPLLKRKYELRKKLRHPVMDDEDAATQSALRDELKFLHELLKPYERAEERESNSDT